jgi:hypothetical protein
LITFMSTTPSASSSETTAFIVFAIIIIVIVRRIYRNYNGVKVSLERTVGYAVFYLAFGAFFIATSFFEGVPVYYVIPDAAVLLAGAYVSYKVSDKRIRFWKPSPADVYYKGGIIIYLVYVVALIARLSIEFAFIGPSVFTFTSTALGQTALLALTVTDLLLSFGVGLLVGRNARVYQRYKLIEAGKETVAAS